MLFCASQVGVLSIQAAGSDSVTLLLLVLSEFCCSCGLLTADATLAAPFAKHLCALGVLLRLGAAGRLPPPVMVIVAIGEAFAELLVVE